MKHLITLFFILAFVSSNFVYSQRLIDAKDYTAAINASVEQLPTPKVTLTWEKNDIAVGFYLFKKKCNDQAFGAQPIAQFDSTSIASKTIITYTDNDIKNGECYEYELWIPTNAKYSSGSTGLISGYAYTSVGIQMPEPTFGTCLILIDSTIAEPLKVEIDRLVTDLQNEGWSVITKTAPRAEKFDKDKVKITKNIILLEYSKNKDISTILLLGRVPVPYSGGFQAVSGMNYPPDGHPDHAGAWPSDMYYGSVDENIWSDVSVNLSTISGQREENKNIPGDGKFDITVLGNNNIQLAVGRVDLYNMKTFHKAEWTNPELELLRRYLNKNHNYRSGNLPLIRKGLVAESESFTAKYQTEGFAASGWRNFNSWFGGANVLKNSFFETLKNDFYLGAYGTGPGGFTSAGGIGSTNDFAINPVNTIFTMLFGSYFGDWDVANSFLRAPLCSEPSALTCGWAARPHWYLHKMTIGYPLGVSVLNTQNNSNLYKTLAIFDATQQRWLLYNVANKSIHTSVMGDPTLTLYPKEEITEPKNLSVVELTNGDIQLKWEAPENEPNSLYVIYRKIGNGKFTLITPNPINQLKFIDDLRYDGTLTYQVKVIKLINTHTGSFFRTSRAISGSLKTTDVIDNYGDESFTASPIPADKNVKFTIYAKHSSNYQLEIFDIQGNLVKSILNEELNNGIFEINWNLSNDLSAKVNSGIYFAKLSSNNGVQIQKIIVY